MAESSTTSTRRRSRTRVATGRDPFSYEGLLTARVDADPRKRRSGLPCPSVWVRLFSNREALVDTFCAERALTDAQRIADALPTFGAIYVRSLDLVDLDVIAIPAHQPVRARSLDCREPDLSLSWPIVQRSMEAAGSPYPDGFILERDQCAVSIFIALEAIEEHTRLDRLDAVALTTLLADRAEARPPA